MTVRLRTANEEPDPEMPPRLPHFEPSPHDQSIERRAIGSALGRALQLLETILESDHSLGMQEICTRLDLPRQSAHRILNQLLELGLLQRHLNRERFTVGPRLRLLALKTAYQSHSTGPFHTVLEALAEQTGETCNLGILDQNKILLIDRVESDWALRVHSEVGKRLEPHASAIGKLILSFLPKARRTQILEASRPLKRFTAFTLVDMDDLEAEFAEIRRRGYSVSNQGTTLGMLSLAAPVRDPDGRIVAGIAVQAPFVRMDMDRALAETVPLMLASAERMERLLAAEEAEPARPARPD
ncbi:IclR family transcriptional regulator domain-containing protein [Propylenella binzhouense]|uniref:IclR family transcriptional regulator domain-containing protein n=1 Tax=Propylenella binzhouense TaxID=2555902 RepID=UPI00136D3819